MKKDLNKNEEQIVIYQTDDGLVKIDVNLKDENIWLNVEQMALLFERDRSVISKHIKNVFDDEELLRDSVCANFAHTANDGKTYNVDYYKGDNKNDEQHLQYSP